MFLITFFVLCILTVHAAENDPGTADFDDIIHGIFNTNKEYEKNIEVTTPKIDGIFNTEKEFTKNYETTTKIYNPNPTTTQKSKENKYKSCGLDKECVPRFLCQNDTINTDGINIIDIRAFSEDCHYMEECCDINRELDEIPFDPVPKEKHEGCGYRNPDGVGFRIEGDTDNEAEFAEFPWMVAILKEEISDELRLIYDCGGALIASNVIITAAHCVKNRVPKELIVRAGEWDTQTDAEILPYVDRYVKEIIVHEDYKKGSLWNDIAILILQEPFEWQENIRPICLPEWNANFDYARCYTTGWGKDKFGREGIYQSILKKIDLPIMPRDKCQTNLRTTRVGKYFNLHESFICAGGEKGKDACTGDGGSPLVCPVPGIENRYYHVGIVAWGIGCGEIDIPGVYASVPYQRKWIDEMLKAHGVDFKDFTI